MEIRINGKIAALKKGTSFEYISENRLFSRSDDYSLSISLPLYGCSQNIAVFGHINRSDIALKKAVYDCEIRDLKLYMSGTATVTELTDTEVKIQFLKGRSEQNFDKTFDKVYINELDLGSPTDTQDATPLLAWQPQYNSGKYVALPWVNDSSGNIQNLVEYTTDEQNPDSSLKTYRWHKDCRYRSWQPYLIHITKMICNAVGYSVDLSSLEKNPQYQYLLICNTLPSAWDMPGFANALPHWTVDEYFEKLELFLVGEFDIDHRAKKISFAFTDDILASKKPVNLQTVVDEYSAQVNTEQDKCDYQGTKNIVYKESSHQMWKFYSCDWFVNGWKNRVVKYNTLKELLSNNSWLKYWNGSSMRNTTQDKLLYAQDVDTYFVIRSLYKDLVREYGGWRPNLYKYTMEMRPVNIFGGRIVDDSDDADSVEIEFVPACIDSTDNANGRLLFLNFSGYDETTSTETSLNTDPETRKAEIDAQLFQPSSVQTLENGEEKATSEYYDRIYVAWWSGLQIPDNGQLPHPCAEDIEIMSDWSSFRQINTGLRLNNSMTRHNKIYRSIEPRVKTTFKFLADTIPDVRSPFLIRGKRYICEKITATFTEDGLSQMMKGDFYEIVESNEPGKTQKPLS